MSDAITIIKGASRMFYVDLPYPDTDEPLDLTGATEITASFPAKDGSAVTASLGNGDISVLGAPGAGRISIEVGGTETDDMMVDPSPNTRQDLQVEVKIGADVIVCILRGVLSITEPAYPIV